MLAIKIKKDKHKNLMAAEANGLILFFFAFRKTAKEWCFWFRGPNDAEVRDGRAFPWIYFTDLCRAQAFLHGEPLWSSEATRIVSGKSYIKRIVG